MFTFTHLSTFSHVYGANHTPFLVLQQANWKLEAGLGSSLIISEFL